MKVTRCDAVEAPFDMLRRRFFFVHLHSLSSAQFKRNETKGSVREREREPSWGYIFFFRFVSTFSL